MKTKHKNHIDYKKSELQKNITTVKIVLGRCK